MRSAGSAFCPAGSPRDGRFLEILGTYNPIAAKDGVKEIRLNIERCRYWLGVGAQPSDVVARLFGIVGLAPKFVHRRQVETAVPKNKREFTNAATAAATAVGAQGLEGDWMAKAISGGYAPWAVSMKVGKNLT